jgi:hypothetical protein
VSDNGLVWVLLSFRSRLFTLGKRGDSFGVENDRRFSIE